MTWQLVQRPASPTSPLVALYHVGQGVYPRLRAAAPGAGIVARSTRLLGAQPSDIAAARARAGCGPEAPIIVGGWSAGCQSVRSLLLAGLEVDAVLAIDGTSGPWPLPDGAAEVRVWRDLARRARERQLRAVLSCTQQTYTEQLPRATKPGDQGPYASTLTVLRRATGLDLQPGDDVTEGGLRVISTPSARIDAAAHIAEQNETLPMALAWSLRAPAELALDDPGELDLLDVSLSVLGGASSWLAGLPALVAPRLVAPPSLGLRALELVRAQLGVRETPGAAHTKAILDFLYGCTAHRLRGAQLAGRRLGLATDETSWCMALQGWADHSAAQDGETVPPWRAACWEGVADSREAGTWRDVSSGYEPKPGDLAFYRRAGGDPRNAWNQGHVVRVASTVTGGHFEGLAGNEGDAVRWALRSMKDLDLVGFRAS